jgi:hypothetical protein
MANNFRTSLDELRKQVVDFLKDKVVVAGGIITIAEPDLHDELLYDCPTVVETKDWGSNTYYLHRIGVTDLGDLWVDGYDPSEDESINWFASCVSLDDLIVITELLN